MNGETGSEARTRLPCDIPDDVDHFQEGDPGPGCDGQASFARDMPLHDPSSADDLGILGLLYPAGTVGIPIIGPAGWALAGTPTARTGIPLVTAPPASTGAFVIAPLVGAASRTSGGILDAAPPIVTAVNAGTVVSEARRWNRFVIGVEASAAERASALSGRPISLQRWCRSRGDYCTSLSR